MKVPENPVSLCHPAERYGFCGFTLGNGMHSRPVPPCAALCRLCQLCHPVPHVHLGLLWKGVIHQHLSTLVHRLRTTTSASSGRGRRGACRCSWSSKTRRGRRARPTPLAFSSQTLCAFSRAALASAFSTLWRSCRPGNFSLSLPRPSRSLRSVARVRST